MLSQNELKVLWGLLRPQTYLLMCIYVLFGISYGLAVQNIAFGSFLSSNLTAIIGLLMGLALWYIAGTSFNDYADYEIDKINLKNDKQRPLIQGLITKRQLFGYALFSTGASFFVILLTNTLPITLLFTALLLLNIAYSLKPIQISHRGGFAPLLLPLGYIVLTVTSGALLTHLSFSLALIMLILGMYVHFLSRIVLKDHRDVKGDKKLGKKTLVLKYGNGAVSTLSLILFITSCLILTTVLWHYFQNGLVFMALFISAAASALVRLRKTDDWPYQRPLITLFGRFCTGYITIMVISLLAGPLELKRTQLLTTFVVVSGVFFWSSFDIARLQGPKSHLDSK